jgi:hypothetical protein
VPPDCNEAYIRHSRTIRATSLAFSIQAIQTLLCNTEMLALSPDVTTVMHLLSPGGKNRCATMPAPRQGSPFDPISVSHSPKRDTTRNIGASSGPVAHTMLSSCASYPPGIYKFVFATSAKPPSTASHLAAACNIDSTNRRNIKVS